MQGSLRLASALAVAVAVIAAAALWPDRPRSTRSSARPVTTDRAAPVPDPADFSPAAREQLGAGMFAASSDDADHDTTLPIADPAHVLVSFEDGTSTEERNAIVRANGGRVTGTIGSTHVIAIPDGTSVPDMLEGFAEYPGVAFVEPNLKLQIVAGSNDTFFPGNVSASTDLWGLHNTGQNGGTPDADIDAPEGWDVAGIGGSSAWPPAPSLTVGVIDTGADRSHPDLLGRFVDACSNALRGTGTLEAGCPDAHGHGTHASGTIAAIGNNGVGVTGVAPNARVLMCKALSDDGSGWTSDIAACVTSMVAQRHALGIRVISMSLGGPASSTLHSAVSQAASVGILVVAAAGNDGNSTLSYPAGYESVVSVAATDRNDGRASFSNANSKVEVSAPGVGIVSTVPRSVVAGGYAVWSGTSMATPHVAGAAALLSWETGLVGLALRSAVAAATDDIGPPGRDPSFGYGRINLCKALGGCGADAEASPSPGLSPTPTATGTVTPSAAPVVTPVPVAKGSVRGTAYRAGRTRSRVAVFYAGPTRGSVKTSRTGRFTADLAPGTYKLTAAYGRKACRATRSSGPTRITVEVTSGTTKTVRWYC
ncbi:MAG TPA: S8 family peptidase [Thermomicrobiales bacterium]|nr:S8 family peptidase [Thermomicrobiales bacterium]